VDRTASAFEIRLEGTARWVSLELAWAGRAEGREDGSLTYALDAEPRRGFAGRRLGLCVRLERAVGQLRCVLQLERRSAGLETIPVPSGKASAVRERPIIGW